MTVAAQDASTHLEQMDEHRERCSVKWCCKQLEAMGYPAPCGYCNAHCVTFWYGTTYIGCETIDNAQCLWWDQAKTLGAREEREARARTRVHSVKRWRGTDARWR